MEFYQPGMKLDKTQPGMAQVHAVEQSDIIRADNAKLAELGYRSEFLREFSVRQILHQGSSITDNRLISSKASRDDCFWYFNHGCCGLRNVDIHFRPSQWFEPLVCYHIRHVEP